MGEAPEHDPNRGKDPAAIETGRKDGLQGGISAVPSSHIAEAREAVA